MFIPIFDINERQNIPLHYATIGLIAANVAVFLLQMLVLGDNTEAGLALIPATFTGDLPRSEVIDIVPEWATLVTYSVLHADFWHLFGNMLFLWVFGDNVEDALGHIRFVVFYLLCAMAGGAAHILWDPDSVDRLIGASGGVAGIVAAYLVLHPRVRVWVLVLGKVPLRLPAFWIIGAWIVFQVAWALIEGDIAVAWWAHVGGIVAGVVLVLILRKPGTPLLDRGLAPEGVAPDTAGPAP
ncbi:MAG: rhomboid family intramembrane serine protease [Bauldia sp.]|nr:rhomboid family intramembrane serine protease [Bauldia sp.]